MPERIIKAGTPPLERFLVGDTVAHVNLGDGVVTAGPPGCVQITYERRYKKSVVAVGGKHIVQNYDAAFFKRCPRFIWHRGDITPIEESVS